MLFPRVVALLLSTLLVEPPAPLQAADPNPPPPPGVPAPADLWECPACDYSWAASGRRSCPRCGHATTHSIAHRPPR